LREFEGQEQRMIDHFEAIRPQKGKPYFGKIRDGQHYSILVRDKVRNDIIRKREEILLELERREKARKEEESAAAKESLEQYRRMEKIRAQKLLEASTAGEAMQIKLPNCVKGMVAPFKMKAIVARALVKYGYHWTEILGKSRKQKVCEVRFEIWNDLQQAGYSLPQIGRLFNKDHTTVLSGIRSYNGRKRNRNTAAA